MTVPMHHVTMPSASHDRADASRDHVDTSPAPLSSVQVWASIIIGFCAAFVYHGASCLMRKLKIDDPLDAFAVRLIYAHACGHVCCPVPSRHACCRAARISEGSPPDLPLSARMPSLLSAPSLGRSYHHPI